MSRDLIALGAGALTAANIIGFSTITPRVPHRKFSLVVSVAIAAISLLAIKYSKEGEKQLSLSDYAVSIGATLVGGALGVAIAITVDDVLVTLLVPQIKMLEAQIVSLHLADRHREQLERLIHLAERCSCSS